MPRQTLEQRVDRLGKRVSALEQLPERIDGLGTQVLQIRTRMDAEFSAIRGELAIHRDEFAAIRGELTAVSEEFIAIRGGPRGPDTPSLRSLQEEIRHLGATLREEIRENGDRIMTQVRVLHEELIARIGALGETRKRTRRRG